VALQPQKKTFLVSPALYFTGVKALPECEPSQNGWLALLPQLHQKYVLPASTSIPKGVSAARTGSAIFELLDSKHALTGN
jgi:hypothetical protein